MELLAPGFLESLRSFLRNPEWTYLYYSDGTYSNKIQIWTVCCDDASALSAMQTTGWPISSGDGNPTYSYHYEGGSRVFEYHPMEKSQGFEPFLFRTSHHHEKFATEWEFSQSARLFLGLWRDPKGKNLFVINPSAEMELAVEFGDSFVRIRSNLLDALLGVRGKNLLQLFEVAQPLADNQLVVRRSLVSDDSDWQAHYFGNEKDSVIDRFQAVSGKFRYLPMLTDDAIASLENTTDIDKTFIVGRNSDGSLAISTSNPDELNNYFDLNPGQLPYLTPVFFKRDVLTKYVDDPERFSLEPTRLFCGYIWSIQIDTTYDNEVMVWLGDLGQYLPDTEYFHWRHHNIFSSKSVSNETIQRDIHGQWVESSDIFLALSESIASLNLEWEKAFSHRFFKNLGDFDRTRLSTLTYPTNATYKGVVSQVEKLALLLIEAINTDYLPKTKNLDGSINRLVAFMKEHGINEADEMVSNLRDLYRTRSKAGAHQIGSDGLERLEDLKAGNDIRNNFNSLVKGLIEDLNTLSNAATLIREQSTLG
jgi:hypothetical protein